MAENLPRIATAADIDISSLEPFLNRFYPPSKCEFLREHGAWWHGGDENRWILLVGQHIAGYCAVIPAQILISGERVPAVWWVDLIIAPEFRGRGFQTLFDDKVRGMDCLKLGFPNIEAAKIHRKHGWGVRNDLHVLMLPLNPLGVKRIRMARGVRGILLRTAALGMVPWARLVRQRFRQYRPRSAYRLDNPSPDVLSAVFERHKRTDLATAYRDVDYLQWRFFDAPYRDEQAFYLAGTPTCPTHSLVMRQVDFQGVCASRIMDLYGDFNDLQGLRDILSLAIRDAVRQGSSQVTAMLTLPGRRSIFRSLGFLAPAASRFCWYTSSDSVMKMLAGNNYWTLSDSDNDSPE